MPGEFQSYARRCPNPNPQVRAPNLQDAARRIAPRPVADALPGRPSNGTPRPGSRSDRRGSPGANWKTTHREREPHGDRVGGHLGRELHRHLRATCLSVVPRRAGPWSWWLPAQPERFTAWPAALDRHPCRAASAVGRGLRRAPRQPSLADPRPTAHQPEHPCPPQVARLETPAPVHPPGTSRSLGTAASRSPVHHQSTAVAAKKITSARTCLMPRILCQPTPRSVPAWRQPCCCGHGPQGVVVGKTRWAPRCRPGSSGSRGDRSGCGGARTSRQGGLVAAARAIDGLATGDLSRRPRRPHPVSLERPPHASTSTRCAPVIPGWGVEHHVGTGAPGLASTVRHLGTRQASASLVANWLFPVEGVDGGRLERGGVGASVPG